MIDRLFLGSFVKNNPVCKHEAPAWPSKNVMNDTKKEFSLALIRGGLSLIVLAAAVGVFIVLSRYTVKPKEKPPSAQTIKLTGMRLGSEPVKARFSIYGTVCSTAEVEVSSEVGGRVVEVSPTLESGCRVRKGQVLVKIDDSDYQFIHREATAALAVAHAELANQKQEIKDNELILGTIKANLELERKDFERNKKLAARDIVSATELERSEQELVNIQNMYYTMDGKLERSRIGLDRIRADIDKLTAQKDRAEYDIGRCTVKAPFSGRLGAVPVEQDEYVVPGTPLFELINDSTVEIPVNTEAVMLMNAFDVEKTDEDHLHWFATPEIGEVSITWTENPAKGRWRGRVTRIENYNEKTRMVTLVVEPNKEDCASSGVPLMPGMFCRVEFTGKEIPGAVRVPWLAVQYDGDVWVVDDQNRAWQRHVEILYTDGDDAIISSGVEPGCRIVCQRMPRGVINGTEVALSCADATIEPPASDTSSHD